MKILRLAAFTAVEYYRATWLYFESILVAVFLFFTLLSTNYAFLTAQDVYMNIGIFSVVGTFFTSLRIVGRETNPRIYVILTKAVSRREYVAAKLAASSALSCAIVALMFALEYALTSAKSQFGPFEAAARLAPVFVVVLISAATVVLFSKLVMENPHSIGWAVVALTLGFAQPPGFVNYVAPPIQQLVKMSFNRFEPSGLVYVAAGLAYIAAVFLASSYLFKRRELNYEKD